MMASSDGRGVPAYAADETEAESEEDDAEDRAPKQGLMIPASMGLRFQVPASLESFDVTASWGIYESVETDKVIEGRSADPSLPADPGRGAAYDPPRRPDAWPDRFRCRFVTMLPAYRPLRRPERSDRVLVEIALCNDRETPMPIPLSMWMFQTKLLRRRWRRRGVPAGRATCWSRTGPSTTRRSGASTSSTATGWSSRSAAPARPTGWSRTGSRRATSRRNDVAAGRRDSADACPVGQGRAAVDGRACRRSAG